MASNIERFHVVDTVYPIKVASSSHLRVANTSFKMDETIIQSYISNTVSHLKIDNNFSHLK